MVYRRVIQHLESPDQAGGGSMEVIMAWKPTGHAPVTRNSRRSPLADWTTASRATLIWLVVRVPVLSEQITVVQPRVSTEGKLHVIER